MKIHGMALLRNEANKWLDDFLIRYRQLCDKIVILDDCSTDDTIKICNNYLEIKNKKYEIHKNDTCIWEENEVKARKKLFDLTIAKAEHEDWIICLDGDELLVWGHVNYVKYCLNHISKTYPLENIDGLGFKLFDMWSNTHYRQDKWWTGHFRYWPMAIRYDKNINYEWTNKKLHCGRFPYNSAKKMNPSNIPIKHMGWSTEELRQFKYDRYMRIDNKNIYGIKEQYESILDKNPYLIEF